MSRPADERALVRTAGLYDAHDSSYNEREGRAVTTSYVMKVSANGQVSIPAEARARWHAEQVVVVDLGDRVVVRPLPEDPITALEGRYRGKGPSTDRARQQARADEAAAARRKTR